MRHRPRLVAGLIALACGAAPAFAGGANAGGAEIAVEVTGLRSAKGVVRACLTDDPARFPRCRDDAAAHRLVAPAAPDLVLTFRGVKKGRYAIALLHDENGNGKADRALLMMPREGFGFSRDAPVRMGPPRFDDAAFTVAGESQRHSIRMRYML